MTSPSLRSTAAAERQALVRALRQHGPHAHTLCEGWTAHDLAVHVAARDARPHLVFGQELPVVGDAAREKYKTFEKMDFEDLLDRIEAGVPSWHPARSRAVDDAVNTVEFFVHTEDVLRAEELSLSDEEPADIEPADTDPADAETVGTELQPRRRRAPEAVQRRLWQHASRTLFLAAARKHNRRITFISPGFGSVTHGSSKDPMISLEGAPGELILWAFGREQAADVTLRRH
ncbi:TIGR03085 family metal-binding protein [Nesterenkonia sp. HG001]|uniref:TIGR03085 family metal-binding protein n=1 Tax=Nesterenkonia sp. HG001 TaxID=2983207 RepID=UPI002AC4C7EE|nr:TIGR03085 family metal-binding protein [Nesterenkonia sp. HG001]MDZ5076089.1 TIGR03085 family metal-binding protein [Nesterenkonia sp. HG001]